MRWLFSRNPVIAISLAIFAVIFTAPSSLAKERIGIQGHVSECLLSESQNPHSPSNIFNTGVENLPSKGEISVLVLQIEFLDLPTKGISNRSFSLLTSRVSEFYSEMSRGELTFNWTLSDQVSLMSLPVREYGAGKRSSSQSIVRIIKESHDSVFKHQVLAVNSYDYLVVIPPASTTTELISTSISLLKTEEYLNATILAADYWQSGQPWQILAHEIGHALGLLDLYSTDVASEHQSNSSSSAYTQFLFMGPYDLMNWPNGPAPSFTAWNLWTLGYLPASSISCMAKPREQIKLHPIQSSGGLRAIFIKLDESKIIVIENRTRVAFDRYLPEKMTGLVVYKVDLNTGNGLGHMRLLPISRVAQAVQKQERVKKVQGFIGEGISIESRGLKNGVLVVSVNYLVNY